MYIDARGLNKTDYVALIRYLSENKANVNNNGIRPISKVRYIMKKM